MAELLVNTHTGEVVFVGEDGHQWGPLESREVYDKRVLSKNAPTVVRRKVELAPFTIYNDKKGDVERDEEGNPITAQRVVNVLSEEVVVSPPPHNLGVVRVAGVDPQRLKYLLERERIDLENDEYEDGPALYPIPVELIENVLYQTVDLTIDQLPKPEDADRRNPFDQK